MSYVSFSNVTVADWEASASPLLGVSDNEVIFPLSKNPVSIDP